MTEQKSAFKGTLLSGDGTLKTFANVGSYDMPIVVDPLLNSRTWYIATTKQECPDCRRETSIHPPRSPELQHWMNEYRWVWQAMAHAKISGDTATVLMRYCAQEIDWQTQAERAKAKHYA